MSITIEERRARDREYARLRRAKRTPEQVEQHREYCRRWHAENREHANARRRQYYLDNFDREREARKEWSEANPDKRRIAMRKQYLKNRERILERNKAWKDANPDKRHAHNLTRRARMGGAEGFFTAEEFADVRKKYDNSCAYCGCPDTALTADHDVPLFRGGSNWISNILPACKTCNSRKGTKTAAEFMEVLS